MSAKPTIHTYEVVLVNPFTLEKRKYRIDAPNTDGKGSLLLMLKNFMNSSEVIYLLNGYQMSSITLLVNATTRQEVNKKLITDIISSYRVKHINRPMDNNSNFTKKTKDFLKSKGFCALTAG
jgi:hypothetical protein